MEFEDTTSWLPHTPGHLRLRGKRCVVVGAGTAVSSVIARVFAMEGCRILAIDERENAVYDLAEIVEKEGGSATPCVVKARSVEELERCLSVRRFSRPDILIDHWSGTDSGREFGRGPFTEERDGLLASFDTIRVYGMDGDLPSLRKTPADLGVDESATKPLGAQLLSRMGVSNEIRTNAVCFDNEFVVSPSATNTGPDRNRNLLQVAYAALFLASDEARYVNGTTVFVRLSKAQRDDLREQRGSEAAP